MFTMVGGMSEASAATRVRPREPRAPPRPGVGPECGGGGGGAEGAKATCSRYADCHRSFAGSSGGGGGRERCYCVVGFKGDGVECEPTTEEVEWFRVHNFIRTSLCESKPGRQFNRERNWLEFRLEKRIEIPF